MLPWHYALAASCGLFIVAAVIKAGRRAGRMPGRSAPWALWGGGAWERALLLGLYALWRCAGSFSVMATSGALPRGRWLWDAEPVIRLPSGTALQLLALAPPIVLQA